MEKKITGVIPPLITTFDQNGNFDHGRMKNLVKFVEKGGVNGVFVCGTYGSGPLMSLKEREEVLETVINSVSSSTAVIAHVGSSNPDEAIELAKHAESVGAVGVASVVPFYYSHAFNDDDVKRFFVELINSVKIPVLLYNNPKASGYTVKSTLLKDLYKEGLAGVKDSSLDLSFFYSVKYEIDFQKFLYIVGTEAFILPTVPLGASGTIAGLANAFPGIVVETFNETKQGNYTKAFELQDKVNKLREIQHFAQSIPAIHALLDIIGVDAGYPRRPFLPVSKETKDKMEEALKKVL
jgi:dihydrodipicolinate synthase/N-acetylneuraminate lyase